MLPRDTSADAYWAQIERFRKMSPSQRVEIAGQLSEDLRAHAAAMIRKRHPEYSDVELKLALFRMVLGDKLFQQAWPTAPLLAP